MLKDKLTVINEIPIFPLPNLVFFPKTLLPLHIFEKRYRQMVEDAKAGEHLIGMALLKQGWESNYFGSPDVHDIACVGKIQQIEKLYDGKYNIMLYGLTRVKILKFTQDKPYRVAQVRYLKDYTFSKDSFSEENESQNLLKLLRNYLTAIGVENLEELLKLQTHSLESIMNQVATILDFSVQEKQNLLELDYLDDRYDEIQKLINERLTSVRVARIVKFAPTDPTWN